MSNAQPPSPRPLDPPTAPELAVPALPADDIEHVARPVASHRVGELTTPWRVAMIVTWVGVFVAYMAVWKTSVEIGIATWWLGPRSNPQPIVVRLMPFALAALFGVLAAYNVRRFPWLSIGGAAVLAVLAVPDLSRSGGLAAVEFAIAGAVAIVSLASLTGMYRPAKTDR